MNLSLFEQKFVDAYKQAIHFTEDDLDGSGEGNILTNACFSPETNAKIVNECLEFISLSGLRHNEDLKTAEQAGHDFWLTRNHHGAGFWDGDQGTDGEYLTKLSQTYPENFAYMGDDGLIYI